MTSSQARRTKRPPGRNAGYVVSIVVNVILLVLVNSKPGWQSLPWITEAFADVVWLINLSLAASIVANIAYLLYDPPRFRAICQFVIALIGFFAAARLLILFPFDFSAYDAPWALLTRIVLVIAIVGSVIAMIVEVVRFVRGGRRRIGHH
jgi:hypothetical protein